jgi:hypothetical protein
MLLPLRFWDMRHARPLKLHFYLPADSVMSRIESSQTNLLAVRLLLIFFGKFSPLVAIRLPP